MWAARTIFCPPPPHLKIMDPNLGMMMMILIILIMIIIIVMMTITYKSVLAQMHIIIPYASVQSTTHHTIPPHSVPMHVILEGPMSASWIMIIPPPPFFILERVHPEVQNAHNHRKNLPPFWVAHVTFSRLTKNTSKSIPLHVICLVSSTINVLQAMHHLSLTYFYERSYQPMAHAHQRGPATTANNYKYHSS